MTTKKLDFETLKSHLFSTSDIFKKELNPEEYRPVIMTVLFIKKLHDDYKSKIQKLKEQGKSEKYARKSFNHTFTMPKEANWDVLFAQKKSIGNKLNQVSRVIETENPRLEGVLTSTKFDDKRNFPDNTMEDLMIHFNKYDLSNDNLLKPGIFGDAYEHMLAKFASETKKKGGQFYTPHEVVALLVRLTKPEKGMRICDPTCGSGGMLIQSWIYIKNKDKNNNTDNLTLHGQEINFQTVGMAKMNLVLHGVTNFKIVHDDVLEKPLLQEGGKLHLYDRVLANYPFSENWRSAGKEDDPYNRFRLGIPSDKNADFAFIQHMYSVLNDKGKAAIISAQGVLFRGKKEAQIRKRLFEEDSVEAIIALPEKLFYGTSIHGCILLLNKNKSKERKDKILFVYAAKDYKEEKVRYTLRDEDLEKITSAVENFKDIDRYCHVADKEELEKNEYIFNVPRYVDTSEPEEQIDIQDAYNELKRSYVEQGKLRKQVETDLKELNVKL